jgi:hypothetical protein
MHDERDDEYNQEHKEEDLRNSGSRERDTSKTEEPRNQGYHQEQQRVVQHIRNPLNQRISLESTGKTSRVYDAYYFLVRIGNHTEKTVGVVELSGSARVTLMMRKLDCRWRGSL